MVNLQSAAMSRDPAKHKALLLFSIVVIAWGLNWSATKVIVESLPPLWTTALRCWIAFAVLVPILWVRGILILPQRGDVPVIMSVGLLHMVAFSALVAAGLQYIPASKGIVLGYTTPLWVALMAPIVLGEKITAPNLIGMLLAMTGLAIILSPVSLDWSGGGTLAGAGMIVLAAISWAMSIVYVRSHRWVATPFQVLPWQVLLAAVVMSVMAVSTEGLPRSDWSAELIGLLMYGGLVATALAYWAMTMVNRSLPALTTALGTLATPLIGIAGAAAFLGEPVELSLVAAAGLITAGIATGTLRDAKRGITKRQP